MTPHAPGSPACRELFSRLSEYLDGELDASICEETETHLGDCPPCQQFLESLRRTVDWVRRLPEEAEPEAVRREVREAVRKLRGPEKG